MAIRIKSRSGETAEGMLRRFKKLCEKEGLIKDIKRKEYYEKPSERARREARKSVARRMRELMGPLPRDKDKDKERKGGGRGGPGDREGGGGGGRERSYSY